MGEQREWSGRWTRLILAINVVALALLFAGMFRTLQRGLFAGAVISLIAIAIVVGFLRADRAARRVMRRREDDEGGAFAPPPLD